MAMLKTKLIRNEDVPYDLLYLADEDDDQINEYKNSAIFWATLDGEKIIGIVGLNEINPNSTEIVCIAVDHEYQNRKIGTNLIDKAISVSKEKQYKEIIIKTGNSGIGQLYLYQRCGFRIDSVKKNLMIENYKKPIYENHIQCVDQIILKYRIFSKVELSSIYEEFWERFLEKHEEYKNADYTVWSFGHTENLANTLLAFVREGKKTGTSSALELYDMDEKVPEVGELSIITSGNGLPGCIIQTQEIRRKKFKDITSEEASLEGEGDLSLEYWKEVHEAFFRLEYAEKGMDFSEQIPVIFERFAMIYDENMKIPF
jgi:aminoglycoside 6'-N-acetyltransferase I